MAFTIQRDIRNTIICVKMINTPDGTSNTADINRPTIHPKNPIRMERIIIFTKLEVNRLAVI